MNYRAPREDWYDPIKSTLSLTQQKKETNKSYPPSLFLYFWSALHVTWVHISCTLNAGGNVITSQPCYRSCLNQGLGCRWDKGAIAHTDTHMQTHIRIGMKIQRAARALSQHETNKHTHTHTYTPFPPFSVPSYPLNPVSLLLKIEQPITRIPFVISRSDTEQFTQRQNDRIYKYLHPASEATPILRLPVLKVSALQYCQAGNNGNMWNQFWNMNGFSVSGVNRVWQQALT